MREFADIPGELFFFEPGDIASFRGDEGTVMSVDRVARQLRLEHWEPTRLVNWNACRLIKAKDEA